MLRRGGAPAGVAGLVERGGGRERARPALSAAVTLNTRASPRLALGRGARTQRVVEHHHALRPGEGADEALDFGEVGGLQLLGIMEVLHRGLVLDEDEAVALESEFLAHGAAIGDLHRLELLLA